MLLVKRQATKILTGYLIFTVFVKYSASFDVFGHIFFDCIFVLQEKTLIESLRHHKQNKNELTFIYLFKKLKTR